MAQQYSFTVSTESQWLVSKRKDSWGNWTTGTWSPVLAFPSMIPKGAKNISAILNVNVTQDPFYGSYFYVDDKKCSTSTGTKTVTVDVAAGSKSKTVEVTFTASGKTGSTAELQLNMALTVSYEYSDSPLQKVENGALVKYKLYRAENGSLVGYNVYRAENGALIQY